VLFASAARFAAHLAFIAAASCARRSGERFNFLFAFFALCGFSVSAGCPRDFFPVGAVARAADFLAAFNAFADSACCSLRLSPASFSEPSRKRFSSCWIFLFNFFGFIIVLLLAQRRINDGVRVNYKILLMSRHSFARFFILPEKFLVICPLISADREQDPSLSKYELRQLDDAGWEALEGWAILFSRPDCASPDDRTRSELAWVG
jgi:hypothetical protein